MKKTEICLSLFVIIIVSLGFVFDAVIPNAYSMTLQLSYSDQVASQKNNMWQLGKNLEIGDSFTYKICDPDSIQNYSAESYHYFTKNLEHNSSLCYTLHLNFINRVISDENQINDDVWIVEASIIDYYSGEIRKSIFHVDAESWNVKSADTIHPDTVRFADSLENTLFSIYKYTAQESKLLQEGIKWGEVTEYRDLMQINPFMTVIDDEQKFKVTEFVRKSVLMIDNSNLAPETQTLDVSKVGYDIEIIGAYDVAINDETEHDNNVTNYYLVSTDLPFPVKAEIFSTSRIVEPHKEYEFELISFFDSTIENNSINENTTDNVKDEVIVESGTIELTFPENVEDDPIVEDPITVSEKDEYIPESNENTDNQGKYDNVIETDDIIITDTTTKDQEISSKSNSSLVLVLMIGIVISAVAAGLFVYLKKFRRNDSVSAGVFGKDEESKLTKKTISFDESITIDVQNQNPKINS